MIQKLKASCLLIRQLYRPLHWQLIGLPFGDHTLLLIFAFTGIAFLPSCSTSSPGPVFAPREQLKNPYFQFYSAQDKDFQNILASSSYRLFRATNPTFLESLSSPQRAQGMFAGLATTFIHGDFHIEQMAASGDKAYINDFDTSDWGPFWVDLIRLESSGLIVANNQSLKLYQPGTCVDTYLEVLAGTSPKAIAKYNIETKLLSVEKSPPKEWNEASTDGVAAKIQEDFRALLESEKRAEKLSAMKILKSGGGSYNSEKYLAEISSGTNSKKYIELKSESSTPLIKLRGSPKSGQMKSCERYNFAVQLFQSGAPSNAQTNSQMNDRADEKPKCWQQNSDRAFARIPMNATERKPSISDFIDEGRLKSHVAWMCEQLASIHKKSWTPYELREILLAFKNPLLKERVLMLARDESKSILDAYRMILESRQTPK